METMMYNEEFRKQAEKAVRLIASRAPYIYDENCGRTRLSRRVEGLWTTSGDRQGHKNVFCYIEKGLENRMDPVASFLTILMQYQQTHGYSRGRTLIASFGGENDEMERCPVSLRTDSIGNAGVLAKLLCKYSIGETLEKDSPSVIRAFTNIAMNTTIVGPTSEDIIVIFKSPRRMLMGRRAKFNYMKRLMRHTAWVTIDDEGSFSIEVGRHIPEEWHEPAGNDDKQMPCISNKVIDEPF